ncbi:flagellar motor protein MotB [Arthrobacter sp. AL08]|uniref:OmpA/MotB family protein n=1 Tax=unclassified Arthrobacter TaxID=235627 RepID=UPI001CFFAB54|nr:MULTISPECIES: flagellar motor protein MotB [unclassified Arthrobacter]MCB5283785.1 Motility protein B [Arthrobacter sp. ES1]MDI3242949.1 flagellar motor protein MotB [Arthrobacter sp. AL05]MDI3278981.1 flagellar motor protein MotB [Arthrobacter sp. AL08]WGZ79953.1 flagellar motor protein MotB [Arthrobacter sp. EM1]
MSPRRRSKRAAPEEHHVDERWLVSYADMVTVLMCLFIVLYAMSTVDANKFEKLRNSLATGFGAVASETVDTATGTVVPADQANKDLEAFAAVQAQAQAQAQPAAGQAANAQPNVDPAALEQAMKEVNRLQALEDKMKAGLAAENLSENVEFQIDPRGLTVKLVGSQTFFEPDRPELTGRATRVLNVVAPVLAPAGMEVMVEGHAANGVTSFPSTWELSSTRAVNVLRFMVERGGVPQSAIGAVAFGSARQVNDDSTPELMELNRRVDIVVLSDQPDVVRSLIPEAMNMLQK